MKYLQGVLQAGRAIYLCSYMTAALPNESSHKPIKLIIMSNNYKIIELRQTLGSFLLNTMENSKSTYYRADFMLQLSILFGVSSRTRTTAAESSSLRTKKIKKADQL